MGPGAKQLINNAFWGDSGTENSIKMRLCASESEID